MDSFFLLSQFLYIAAIILFDNNHLFAHSYGFTFFYSIGQSAGAVEYIDCISAEG